MRYVILRAEGNYGFGYWSIYDAETNERLDTRINVELDARRRCERNGWTIVG